MVVRKPGVQKPHCRPWHSRKACCTGPSSPSGRPSPSTVVTVVAWPRVTANIRHERTGCAVEQHRARAADAVLAADVGAGQPQVVAQEVGQQPPRGHRRACRGTPLTVTVTSSSSSVTGSRHAAGPRGPASASSRRCAGCGRAAGVAAAPGRGPAGQHDGEHGGGTRRVAWMSASGSTCGAGERRRPRTSRPRRARARRRPRSGRARPASPGPTRRTAARGGDRRPSSGHHGRDAAQRVVAVPAGDLDERACRCRPASRRKRAATASSSGAQRRLERAEEEVAPPAIRGAARREPASTVAVEQSAARPASRPPGRRARWMPTVVPRLRIVGWATCAGPGAAAAARRTPRSSRSTLRRAAPSAPTRTPSSARRST